MPRTVCRDERSAAAGRVLHVLAAETSEFDKRTTPRRTVVFLYRVAGPSPAGGKPASTIQQTDGRDNKYKTVVKPIGALSTSGLFRMKTDRFIRTVL